MMWELFWTLLAVALVVWMRDFILIAIVAICGFSAVFIFWIAGLVAAMFIGALGVIVHAIDSVTGIFKRK